MNGIQSPACDAESTQDQAYDALLFRFDLRVLTRVSVESDVLPDYHQPLNADEF